MATEIARRQVWVAWIPVILVAALGAGLALRWVKASAPTAEDVVRALRAHDTARLNELLERGASLTAVTGESSDFELTEMTPLLWAVEYDNADAVRTLVKHGANPDERHFSGRTALQWAIDRMKQSAAVALIHAGARFDVRGREGATPLIDAASYGLGDTCDALIRAGARVDDRDDYGTSAMGCLFSGFRSDTRRGEELLLVVVDSGFDPHSDILWGWGTRQSLLVFAVRKGSPEFVAGLLARGGDPCNEETSGYSAMDYIDFRTDEHADTIKRLLVERVMALHGATECPSADGAPMESEP